MIKQKGFFDGYVNRSGNFANQYVSKTISGDKVVIDRATGLMWHQSGSSTSSYLSYEEARQWIRDLNNRVYAGYSDWRLPTVEEGASLLESSKLNGDLYIDPVFSKNQRYIWTGDKESSSNVWMVNFRSGIVNNTDGRLSISVRPVRSGQ
jgi:hypothetical protein